MESDTKELKQRLTLLCDTWDLFMDPDVRAAAKAWEKSETGGKRKREQSDAGQTDGRSTWSKTRSGHGGDRKRKRSPNSSGISLTEHAVSHLEKRQKADNWETSIRHWVAESTRASSLDPNLPLDFTSTFTLHFEMLSLRSHKMNLELGSVNLIASDSKSNMDRFSPNIVNATPPLWRFGDSILLYKANPPPFEGHTDFVTGLALSFDHALFASASLDNTIKLWAFESRQLFAAASFDAQNVLRLIISPDSCQLAHMVITQDDCKICICDIPPDVQSQARAIACKKSTLNHLLHVHLAFFHLFHHTPIAIIVV
ncbi:hypothetical protein EV702DRAFT_1194620 [Suillus placidus]|uniref:Uncharacterized protein n=1 Tax=Suillus placidus TaxID=48579 RepID=A0A9P6ZZZ4_9AGAM|nr:hypothetical protein EV702DRAFT_1194620 [Suillus placidus]